MNSLKKNSYKLCKARKYLSSQFNKFRPYSIVNFSFLICSCSLGAGLSVLLLYFFTMFIFILIGVDRLSAIGELKTMLIILALNTAILGMLYNIRRHLSEDYYKEAKEQLSKAYESLNVMVDGRLSNDRLRWLTTARMIKTSEALSSQIMMQSHKDLYREEKQYWRIKFGEILKDFPSEFFAAKPEHLSWSYGNQRSPIDESSLVVIYRFVQWPKDYIDPLVSLSFTDEEIDEMPRRGRRGLGDLLAAHREWRSKL